MGEDKRMAPSTPLLTPPLSDVFGDSVFCCCGETLLIEVVVVTIVVLLMMAVGCTIGAGS